MLSAELPPASPVPQHSPARVQHRRAKKTTRSCCLYGAELEQPADLSSPVSHPPSAIAGLGV